MVKMKTWMEHWLRCLRWSERENDREHIFKPCKMEADWLKEGRREDEWTRVMLSVSTLTAWESGSDVKNRQATEETLRKTDK